MKITTKWKPIEELVCFQLGRGKCPEDHQSSLPPAVIILPSGADG